MIPLKIETLLEGRVVEHDRVEYKTGWNPNDIIHSICAFANDYDNSNGGYIVIGVKEENGMPVFPLAGVQKEELDSIQQEIFQYCNMIVPRYIPRMVIIRTLKHILYTYGVRQVIVDHIRHHNRCIVLKAGKLIKV